MEEEVEGELSHPPMNAHRASLSGSPGFSRDFSLRRAFNVNEIVEQEMI